MDSDARVNWPAPVKLVLRTSAAALKAEFEHRNLELELRFWAFGITDTNEIRSLSTFPDTRWEVVEGSNKQMFYTKTILGIAVVADPRIKRKVTVQT